MMTHAYDELPAYALGALDRDERETVDEHLASCETCQAELEHLATTLCALPLALDPVDAPIDLKSRILAAARQEESAGESLELDQGHSHEIGDRPRAGVPEGRSQLPVGVTRNRMLSLTVVSGFAVALFAVGLAVGGLFAQHGPSKPEQQYEHLVALAVTRGDTVTALRATTGAPSPFHVSVDQSLSGQTSLIVGPSAPPKKGSVYELWFIKDSKPVKAGDIKPTDTTAKTIPLARSSAGYQIGAMTLEPGPSGTKQPTVPPFVEGSLPRA